jgi:hypothetical protein
MRYTCVYLTVVSLCRQCRGSLSYHCVAVPAPNLTLFTALHTEWCHESKAKYNVVPMRSWGNLPMNYVETWRSRRCDLIFTTERMSGRPLSSCPDTSNSGGGERCGNVGGSALCCAVLGWNLCLLCQWMLCCAAVLCC